MADQDADPQALAAFGFVLEDGTETIMWRAQGYERDHTTLASTATEARRTLEGVYVPPEREDWGSGLPLSEVRPVPRDEIRMWNVTVNKRNGTPDQWRADLANNHEVAWAVQVEEERAGSDIRFLNDADEIEATALDMTFGRAHTTERHPGLDADDARGYAMYLGGDQFERGWKESDIVSITDGGPVVSHEDLAQAREASRLTAASAVRAPSTGRGVAGAATDRPPSFARAPQQRGIGR